MAETQALALPLRVEIRGPFEARVADATGCDLTFSITPEAATAIVDAVNGRQGLVEAHEKCLAEIRDARDERNGEKLRANRAEALALEWQREITAVTPGGSEYCDPKFTAAWLRMDRDAGIQARRDLAVARKELQAARALSGELP